jgi:hypothetical protein
MCHLWNRIPPTPACRICHPDRGWPGFCWKHAALWTWAWRMVDDLFEPKRTLVVPDWPRRRAGGEEGQVR